MQKPEGKAEGQQPLDDTLEKPQNHAPHSKVDDGVENDYLKLRRLLLGDDYSEALHRYISKEEDVDRIVEALPKALKKSSLHDLGESLAPVVDQAIGKSIDQNPSRITNILFPIMGPAIRKAVASALAEMVQSLNTLLEQSLSFGSLRWRIQAWRAGMPYAKYVLLQTMAFRVEQVLLVHKDTGLLLNSVTAAEVETQDPELVSSMLTAISDFVSDSFSGGRETLERIRFGDLELYLNVGPHAILAIAVRGSASDELFLHAHTTIEIIHADFAQQLKCFDGDRTIFEKSSPILSECLLSQKVSHKSKRKPWLAVSLIIGFMAYLIGQSITSWQLDQQFKQLETSMASETGYVVISTRREGKRLYVKALRSPESRSEDDIESSLANKTGVGIMIDANVVHFGALPKPVVKPQTNYELFQTLVYSLQNTTFYFEAGKVQLSEIELMKIPSLIKNITEIERLVNENQFENFQIILMGFADSSGSSSINKKVSQLRANEVKSILTANKINADIIVTWGAGNIDRDDVSEDLQRRVTLQVLAKPKKQNASQQGELL